MIMPPPHASVHSNPTTKMARWWFSLTLVLALWCMRVGAVDYASQRVNDLETIVPPYVDAFGAPIAKVKVVYPEPVGKVKLGKLYTKNDTQPQPHVSISGDAVHKKDFYSLVVVDPDARSPDNFTVRNVLHWLVVNIPGSIKKSENITEVGTEVSAYRGPAPPIGTHRYIFLLFSQGRDKVFPTSVPGRLFSVRNFTDTYGLGWPLGGTLFRASFDDQ